jgi:hypothetical protein
VVQAPTGGADLLQPPRILGVMEYNHPCLCRTHPTENFTMFSIGRVLSLYLQPHPLQPSDATSDVGIRADDRRYGGAVSALSVFVDMLVPHIAMVMIRPAGAQCPSARCCQECMVYQRLDLRP